MANILRVSHILQTKIQIKAKYVKQIKYLPLLYTVHFDVLLANYRYCIITSHRRVTIF